MVAWQHSASSAVGRDGVLTLLLGGQDMTQQHPGVGESLSRDEEREGGWAHRLSILVAFIKYFCANSYFLEVQ
jgi:hypothetical protein